MTNVNRVKEVVWTSVAARTSKAATHYHIISTALKLRALLHLVISEDNQIGLWFFDKSWHIAVAPPIAPFSSNDLYRMLQLVLHCCLAFRLIQWFIQLKHRKHFKPPRIWLWYSYVDYRDLPDIYRILLREDHSRGAREQELIAFVSVLNILYDEALGAAFKQEARRATNWIAKSPE